MVEGTAALATATGTDLSQVIEAGTRRIAQALDVAVSLHRDEAGPQDAEGAVTVLMAHSAADASADTDPALPHLHLRLGVAEVPEPLQAALGVYLRAVAGAIEREAQATRRSARLEAKVDRRDHLLRRLFDLSPVGVMLIEDATALILEANAAFLSFGAWQREEVVGKTIIDLLPPSDQHVRAEAVRQLGQGQTFGPIENTFQRPDGTVFPAIVRGLSLENAEGARIIWVLVEDVSLMRQQLAAVEAAGDESLRARSELTAAVQALPHGFVLFDEEDRVVLMNERMAEVFPEFSQLFVPGRRYLDILTEGVQNRMFPEAFGREQAFIDEIMTARAKPSFERLTILNEGRVIRVLDSVIPTGGRVGLRIDMTESTEVARRLQDVIEGSQAGTWEVDLATGQNFVNSHWSEMLGYREEDLAPITSDTWMSLIHPDDRAATEACVDRLFRGEISQYDQVYRMRGAGGQWVWINDRGRISARAPNGEPKRMVGVHLDVTALKEAEERLERIIEGAEAATWQFDVQKGVNRINNRWAEMIGYTREEVEPVTEARWRSLVHPDDFRALERDQVRRFQQREWLFDYELRLQHKDGHWVWIQSRGRVTDWDDSGAPRMMSGVHLDISARKRLETDLKTERDFLATLTETSVSGILAVDAEARILFFNREVQDIFEVEPDVLMGMTCDPDVIGVSFLDGSPMTLCDMPCRRAIALGQTLRDVRLRVDLPEGRFKVVSINAAPLPDTGMKARVVCTVTDITSAAETEVRLRAAIEHAEAANRAKSQFLANMSHELRTPLNGVLGMADLLAEGGAPEDRQGMIQSIRESGSLLLSILNDILDLAKIESGKLSLEPQPFAFADLAARVEAMHGLMAQAKGLSLTVHIDPSVAGTRLGDAQRLLQVLHNLVGNAVKFTETGYVALAIRAEGPEVHVVVRDSGIGMTSEQSAHVFDEFTQGDGSITRRFGGTGLGLPIVRRLVGLMGGRVDLHSVPGQGTTVTVQVPLPQAETALATPDPEPQPDVAGLRALVAEDNPTNRVILRAMLDRLGMQAEMVHDGDEAVAAWQDGAFDVLILDISMPRKDGLSALSELRAKAGSSALPPAIAVTANAMTHLVTDYLAAGFAAVVAKPLQLDDLGRAVAQVCKRSGSAPAA